MYDEHVDENVKWNLIVIRLNAQFVRRLFSEHSDRKSSKYEFTSNVNNKIATYFLLIYASLKRFF